MKGSSLWICQPEMLPGSGGSMLWKETRSRQHLDYAAEKVEWRWPETDKKRRRFSIQKNKSGLSLEKKS